LHRESGTRHDQRNGGSTWSDIEVFFSEAPHFYSGESSQVPGQMRMNGGEYVHGYSEREAERLGDQARTLTALLHNDTRYPAGSRVLEAGCGTGAQTLILAKNSPDAEITSVDISPDSIRRAEARVRAEGITNVTFQTGDLFSLPFAPKSFDHVFVCFVLEHLADPGQVLHVLRSLIRPGGTITVIEGDHGSAYYHPDSAEANKAIRCLIRLQREAGGNALIGRELYPLLVSAGYADVQVSPRMVYVDASRPALVDGFTRQTFTAMVEGVRDTVLERGLMTESQWNQGISDLYRTCEPDGVFCYTFFKATGIIREKTD
jgi:SAM-dependent methyltransferase